MRNNPDQHRPVASGAVQAGAGLLALAVAMGIGRFAFTPVLPMMLQDGSLSIAGGALLAAGNYVGYLIGALISTLSTVMLRIGKERAIRGGLLAIGATTLAMGLPLGLAAWLALRLLAGVASAWVLISVSAWCLDTLAAYRRPFLNSVVFAGVGAGIVLAGLACLALMHRGDSASQAWLLLGVSALAATALAWPAFSPAPRPADAAPANAADVGVRLRRNAQALRLVCCYGIFGFGYIIPATFLPVMAKGVLRDSALFGWSWPLFGLAAALSTLAVAPLVRRFGNRRLWMASQLVMAGGVAVPVAWPQAPLPVFAAALCVGGTFMVVTLTAVQEAKRIAGAQAGVLIAAMTSAFAAGQIAGPLLAALGAGEGGGGGNFSASLLLAAGLLAASALLLRTDAGRVAKK